MINQGEILDRVARTLADPSLKIDPQARFEGCRLFESWMTYTYDFDIQFHTLAVEIPWFLPVDKFTIVVGVQDRIYRDAVGIAGSEWKTAKGTTRYWNEEKWLDSIKRNHQIAIYGLAQREGYFPASAFFEHPSGATVVHPDPLAEVLIQLNIKQPRILVRAITKENPPAIWGNVVIPIDRKRLNATKSALIVRGAQIRAARESGLVPWQLSGLHCENRFSHTICPFYEKFCGEHNHPEVDYRAGIGLTDPGNASLQYAKTLLRVPLDDPRVVILSASAYEDANDCVERYRLQGTHEYRGPYAQEQDKGTALHAAVASYYKILGEKK